MAEKPFLSNIPNIAPPDAEAAQKISSYIHRKWLELVRTHENFFQGVLADEKVPHKEDADPILYVARTENLAAVKRHLQEVRKQLLSASSSPIPEIEVRALPQNLADIAHDEHGLLYLPYPYVVPGGRFNETYGWDSAFIVHGLILDGYTDIAKGLVEDKLYSIRHYGMILNANRSYYLGRSQAPFLTQKILDVFHHSFSKPRRQKVAAISWLKSTLDALDSYYAFWTSAPYLHEASGLSFYNDLNETPAPEVEFSEKGHYPHALEQLRDMYITQQSRLARRENRPLTYQERKDAYYLSQFYCPVKPSLSGNAATRLPQHKRDALSTKFYRGDRAMRASGFDPSRRFGFFNVDAINLLPVCLNSLLYKMEIEAVEIYKILSHAEPDKKEWEKKTTLWKSRADKRKKAINEWLWDDAKAPHHDGASYPGFRDAQMNLQDCEKYDLPRHRPYVFATAFYPLWTGMASKEQAEAVVKHIYSRLITKNGLMSSDRETGSQWDAPFAWAPLQVIAVRGLLRYGYKGEAMAIVKGFTNTVIQGFEATGNIFEKYDMQSGSHQLSHKIDKGYNTNVEGFGWTNAVIQEFLQLLQEN